MIEADPVKTARRLPLFAFLGLALLCGLGAKKAPPKQPGFLFLVTLPGTSSEIWAVGKNGKAKRHTILPKGVVEGTLEGSTAPCLSPKGDKLAYLQGNNLYVKDLRSGKALKITQEGFAKDKLYEPVYPLISGWSFDGTKLLYYLKHAEPGEEGEEDGPQRKVMPLTYGYYLYDLSLSESKSIAMEGYNFCGWDAQDEMLFQQLNTSVITAVDLGAHTRDITVKIPGASVDQVFASFSGAEALALAGEVGKWSKVVKVDLSTGGTEEVSTPFGWGDCNWPSLSPSGKRTAWIQTVRDDAGVVGQFLVVDKNVTLKVQYVNRYQWMNEEKIVLVNAKKPGKLELLVVRADDGVVLDRHPL